MEKSKLKNRRYILCCRFISAPSRYDNLPQVGLEAQSTGLPIICFDVGGVKELVKHKKNGFIVKKYSIEKFSKGIDWCLKNLNSVKFRKKCMFFKKL